MRPNRPITSSVAGQDPPGMFRAAYARAALWLNMLATSHRKKNGIVFGNINVAEYGSYKMIVCYMAGADGKAYIKVNDGQPVYYGFEWTGGRNGFYLGSKEIEITLKAGSSTIEFGNDKGDAPDLDRIIIQDKK